MVKTWTILFLILGNYCFGQDSLDYPILKSCIDAADTYDCTRRALYQYISENIEYPKIARENNVEGVVRVSFIITQVGKLTAIKVEDCFGGGTCNQDYIKKVLAKLDWQNGKRNSQSASFQILNYPIFLDLEKVNHVPPHLEMVYFRAKINRIKIGGRQEKTITEATAIIPETPKKDLTIYQSVDQPAIFPGCQNGGPFGDSFKAIDCSNMALSAYIQKELKYPIADYVEGKSGVVQLTYVIEKDGTLSNINVQKGISEKCNQAAINALNKMNKQEIRWKPAQLKGKKVRSQQMIRIRFSIAEEKARREKNGQ